jgi:uncharacterized protein YndB with AHSA1/START domain
MTLPDIVCDVTIDASVSRVWTCLTEEGLVGEWLGCVGFRAEVGALFYMQPDPTKAGSIEGATHCEVEVIAAPERIVFSWFLPGTPKTHVEIALIANPDGTTTARLTHSGWDQFDAGQLRAVHEMLAGGWRSGALPNLRRVAEQAA